MRLHRSEGDAEHLGCLLVREVRVVAGGDRGALAVRERGDRAFEVDTRGDIGRFLEAERRVLGCLVDAVHRQLAALAHLALPGVEGDPVEPRREARLEAEAAEVAPREHERILREVVGEGRVAAGEPPKHGADLRLVAADELGEGLAVVAVEDREDEVGVARGYLFLLDSIAQARISARPIIPGMRPIDQGPWISWKKITSAMPRPISMSPPRRPA